MSQIVTSAWKPLPRFNRLDFNNFRNLIREQCGLRIPDSKKLLLKNRIGKRLRELGYESFDSYFEFVTSQHGIQNELSNLWSVVTTHQTYFFREPHHFEALRHNIIPELTNARADNESIKVWSAGCSSGEEAYTLAAILDENLANRSARAHVLATDIDNEMIDAASDGQYPLESQKTIPVQYREKYFERDEKLLRPRSNLKQMITFKQQNLRTLRGIYGKFDVIFCRNVIMYFEPEFRLKLMQFFDQVLRDDGFLFLGSSESFHGLPRIFEYQKIGKTLVHRKANMSRALKTSSAHNTNGGKY